MITQATPVLVSLLGLLLYVFGKNPKASEIGRVVFAVGLLFVVATMTGKLFLR